MEKEERRLTSSGIELYSYKNPSSHGFYISLFLRAGSMYEEESLCGITHFYEHIAIRNVNAVMNGELYSLLDKYGIEFNASTYSEMVQFYVSGALEHFNIGAKILSLVLAPIILTSDNIRTECARIKAEIRENNESTSLSGFTSGIVYKGTNLARSITGTLGGISKINLKKLSNYREKNFTKENIFLYVTGNFDENNLDFLSKEISRHSLGKGEAHENIAPVPEGFGRRDGKVHIKNADFTMVRFTFDMDMTKVKSVESDLVYDILLSGYNSRFFIEMSEKRGLFYDLNGATERYRNIGTFTFSYEVKPDAVYDAVEMTLELLHRMKEETLLDEECMKAGYVDNAKMLYDDIREFNFTFAYDNHIMMCGYESLDARRKAYERVTPDDIKRVFGEIFKRENMTVTMKGKKRKIDTDKLEEIIARYN